MKDVVITCAGGSTRFSNSVNDTAHKSIYKAKDQIRCLLEWQIDTALSSKNVNKIIVVVGFQNTQVDDFVKSTYGNDERIVIVNNEQWSTTGSNLSMCLGLLACKNTKADSILCVEGDLYASNFKELIDSISTSGFRSTTNGHSTVDSNVDVLGIISKTSTGFRTSFEYSTSHSVFENINYENVVTLFPSGQMCDEEGSRTEVEPDYTLIVIHIVYGLPADEPRLLCDHVELSDIITDKMRDPHRILPVPRKVPQKIFTDVYYIS